MNPIVHSTWRLAALLLLTSSLFFLPSSYSQLQTRQTISPDLLGFPYDVIVDRALSCYVGSERYVARESIFRLKREFFTTENLEILFDWESDMNISAQEYRILVISDSEELQVILSPRIGTAHGSDQIDPTVARIANRRPVVAQYYRFQGNQVYWHSLSSAEQKAYQPIVLAGTDPYSRVKVPFFFKVMNNTLQQDLFTGVECLRRNLDILMRPCDLTRANLVSLFQGLAALFTLPVELHVQVWVDPVKMENRFKADLGLYGVYALVLMNPGEIVSCNEVQMGATEESVFYRRNAEDSFYSHYRRTGPSVPERVEVPVRK